MTAQADSLSHTLAQHRQLARLAQRLDDALGLHHGLSWSDLLLLDALHDAGGRLSTAQAAAATSRSPAGLLRQVLPMEKIGLVQRDRAGCGAQQLVLAAGGPAGCARHARRHVNSWLTTQRRPADATGAKRAPGSRGSASSGLGDRAHRASAQRCIAQSVLRAT